MKAIYPISLAALCLALSDCGGGGGSGSLASTPPPIPAPAPAPSPSPTPTQPPPVTLVSADVVSTPLTGRAGLIAGTSNTIALAYERGAGSKADASFGPETVKFLGPSALRLTIEPVGKTYTLEFGLPGYPAKEVYDLSREPTGFLGLPGTGQSNFGNRVATTERYSDGTTKTTTEEVASITQGQQPVDNGKGQFEVSRLEMNLGLRYVTYGLWTHDFREKTGPSSFTLYNSDAKYETYFVSGRRTLSGEIPKAGKATYNATIFANATAGAAIPLNGPGKLVLTADFTSRLIAAAIDAPATYYDEDGRYSYWGTDLDGSAVIGTSGDYQISLTGTAFLTAEVTDNNTAQSRPMTGSVLGALFGPGAEETGGVLHLMLDGSPLFYGSFVGAQSAP